MDYLVLSAFIGVHRRPNSVRRELDRRRRAELRRSLRSPHPEAPGAGKPVRWVPGKGWAPPVPQIRFVTPI
jgi:hypothetical protein